MSPGEVVLSGAESRYMVAFLVKSANETELRVHMRMHGPDPIFTFDNKVVDFAVESSNIPPTSAS